MDMTANTVTNSEFRLTYVAQCFRYQTEIQLTVLNSADMIDMWIYGGF